MNVDISFLEILCQPGVPRSIVNAPFSAEVDGQQWAVATNGIALWAVAQESSLTPLNDPFVTAMLATRAAPAAYASLSALRCWAGYDTLRRCLCGGRGWVAHSSCEGDGCTQCDRGFMVCPDCRCQGYRGWRDLVGAIRGAYINPVLLATPLHRLCGDRVAVAMDQSGRHYVRFATEAWCIVIAQRLSMTPNDRYTALPFCHWSDLANRDGCAA